MTVHRVVCLDLPSKDDILLLGRNLEGVVMPLPAKEARQDLVKLVLGLMKLWLIKPAPCMPTYSPDGTW